MQYLEKILRYSKILQLFEILLKLDGEEKTGKNIEQISHNYNIKKQNVKKKLWLRKSKSIFECFIKFLEYLFFVKNWEARLLSL